MEVQDRFGRQYFGIADYDTLELLNIDCVLTAFLKPEYTCERNHMPFFCSALQQRALIIQFIYSIQGVVRLALGFIRSRKKQV